MRWPTLIASLPPEVHWVSLSDLALKISYRSGRDAMVGDFFNPCLASAILYRRAVGYFTGSGLAQAAKGIASLADRHGVMQLVASPYLEDIDVEALRLGHEDRQSILKRVAVSQLADVENILQRQRLNALAWLVANDTLQVKLALRVDGEGRPTKGIYHEKIGIFADHEGNLVTFTGSSNETTGGLVENFESIRVFWSWDDPHGHTGEQLEHFDQLWENDTQGVEVIDFTEVAAEVLERYKLRAGPEPDRDEIANETFPCVDVSQNGPHVPSWLTLRSYQRNGLEKWKKAGGRGILAIATGGGKTITALYLAARMFENNKPLALIVVCPYINLANQWLAEMKKFGIDAIPCFDSRKRWQSRLRDAYLAVQVRNSEFLAVVVSNKTFLSEAFQASIHPKNLSHLLVADEVHNLGARELAKRLNPDLRFRLGLSATPERHRDSEGTQAIFDYFGDVVYEFGIKEAIANNVLCRYFYYPVLVDLTEDEAQSYWSLSEEISRLFPRKKPDAREDHPVSKRLDRLLIERARLLASAANKLPALAEQIASLDEGDVR